MPNNRTTNSTGGLIAVIPARYGSTRFPGKPLALIHGKPMIQWVCEQADKSQTVDDVVVATDDKRIFRTVEEFGGKAVMTATEHRTGSDRIAEAVEDIECDFVINLQGDEPLLPADVIDQLAASLKTENCRMATVAVPFENVHHEVTNPNAVKVVTDGNDFALYFSRSPIPFCRDGNEVFTPLLHWGLYGYSKEFLLQFVKWPPGRLEQTEQLEQLRALENGADIKVIRVNTPTHGVDTPEDIEIIENMLTASGAT
ncbi:MAG: 3-deoxy-manno-octulosonate cytidylyltransferase [Verrucomicrobiota bacterium]